MERCQRVERSRAWSREQYLDALTLEGRHDSRSDHRRLSGAGRTHYRQHSGVAESLQARSDVGISPEERLGILSLVGKQATVGADQAGHRRCLAGQFGVLPQDRRLESQSSAPGSRPNSSRSIRRARLRTSRASVCLPD